MTSSIRTFTHYRNVVILTFGNLAVMFGFSMFSPIMPIYLLNVLGGTMLIVGLFTSTFALMRALLQPLMGRISDRIGRKKMIVPALFSYTFVSYLYSTATTAFEFVGYRAVQGISSSTLWPASDALIADTVPTQERGRALGAISMTYQVGTLIAPAIGALVAYAWGFKEVFYVCALFSLAGAMASLLFLREPRKAVVNRKSKDLIPGSDKDNYDRSALEKWKLEISIKEDLQSTMRRGRRVIFFLGATSLLSMATFSMIEVILSVFITYAYGGTIVDVGVIFMLFGLTGALGAFTGGSLADKYSRRKLLLISSGIGSLFWLGLLSANTLELMAAIVSLFAFVGSMSGPATSALVADLTPPERRGATYGLIGMFNDSGMFVGPIMGGLLVDYVKGPLGLGLIGGLQSLFIVNALLTIIATVLIAIGVREPKAKY